MSTIIHQILGYRVQEVTYPNQTSRYWIEGFNGFQYVYMDECGRVRTEVNLSPQMRNEMKKILFKTVDSEQLDNNLYRRIRHEDIAGNITFLGGGVVRLAQYVNHKKTDGRSEWANSLSRIRGLYPFANYSVYQQRKWKGASSLEQKAWIALFTMNINEFYGMEN